MFVYKKSEQKKSSGNRMCAIWKQCTDYKAKTICFPQQYLEQTLAQMTEAWEDILLEMDSKLAKFADDKRVSQMIVKELDIIKFSHWF